jgi:tRNA A-37 threonylcarbamoyl transferase component Bud32
MPGIGADALSHQIKSFHKNQSNHKLKVMHQIGTKIALMHTSKSILHYFGEWF